MPSIHTSRVDLLRFQLRELLFVGHVFDQFIGVKIELQNDVAKEAIQM